MTFWTNDSLRVEERASIRAFVESCSEHLTGQVLDYGCGKQPYRDVIEAAGGLYHGFDRVDLPGNVSGEDVGTGVNVYDAVICNQVIQYVPEPVLMLRGLWLHVRPGGHLVLTGPTNWPEVEPEDLHRFTLAGARKLVEEAGWSVERAERRAVMDVNGIEFSLGYGILGRRSDW